MFREFSLFEKVGRSDNFRLSLNIAIALAAAMRFEFTPGLCEESKVPVWVAIPIAFSVKRVLR